MGNRGDVNHRIQARWMKGSTSKCYFQFKSTIKLKGKFDCTAIRLVI